MLVHNKLKYKYCFYKGFDVFFLGEGVYSVRIISKM